MTIAVMQPYFFPYIGYFQLMNVVDQFVVYDNIEFSRKGWINRNRVLVNGADIFVTIPLKKDSDYLMIHERFLADNWSTESVKILNRIRESYRRAPYFKEIMPFLEDLINYREPNLFLFLYNSIFQVKRLLGISATLVVSSTISIDHSLRSQEKVIALCKAQNATKYFNPIGGLNLYDKQRFLQEGLHLNFIRSQEVNYDQFENPFVPWLSIIDVLMFNSIDRVKYFLNQFTTE